jgi:multiple antibiotic resistance protein
MGQISIAVNFFVALFALIDPVGNVALFAAATAGARARDRAELAVYISLFVLGFLIVFFFTGLGVLKLYGVSIAAFRIAGGVILLLLGLQMVRDDFTVRAQNLAAETAGDDKAYVRRRIEHMITPFAMPLLIGPGAISTVVIYAGQARSLGWGAMAMCVAAMVAVSLSTLACFLATPLITRILGKIGLTVVVRVLGLVLSALAIQFVLTGLAQSTVGLIRPEVASP